MVFTRKPPRKPPVREDKTAIECPYCGTAYYSLRTTCDKCGALLTPR